MILAVNPNTGIDRVLFVPRVAWNRTLRATASAWGMAGKASDAAWVLGALGYRPTLLGFAAGETGQRMRAMLEARGVRTDFTWTGGTSRTNIVIVGQEDGTHTTITAEGLEVLPEHVDDLRARYTQALEQATCVILAGKLPDGVDLALNPELIRQAHARGVPVVYDASGPALPIGLEAAPTMVKPNREELEALVGRALRTQADVRAAARDILARGVKIVLATLGTEGALAVTEGRAYHIPPVPVEVVNPAGAGDAVLAGMAAALAQGKPFEEGLRLAFAAAAAVCLTPGTADCRREDVERLLPQVQLIPMD